MRKTLAGIVLSVVGPAVPGDKPSLQRGYTQAFGRFCARHPQIQESFDKLKNRGFQYMIGIIFKIGHERRVYILPHQKPNCVGESMSCTISVSLRLYFSIVSKPEKVLLPYTIKIQ